VKYSEEALQASPAAIRRGLPIPYVMEQNDHFPQRRTGDRLHYVSPFRSDNDPSLDVWMKNEEWRFGDFGEGSQGSVIDLVKRFDSCTDGEAINNCRRLFADFVESDWAGPSLADGTAKLDPEDLRQVLQSGNRGAEEAANSLLLTLHDSHPGLESVTAEWLVSRWGVRAHSEEGVLIPYVDTDGRPVGAKHRYGNVKLNLPGSQLPLYGIEHLTEFGSPIILCEGETDAWALDHLLGDQYLVLSCSAGRRPENLIKLMDEKLWRTTVYLCFDGDDAGRSSSRRWEAALRDRGADIMYVPMPEGADVSSLSPDRISALPYRAKPFLQPPDDIKEARFRYVRPSQSDKGNDRQLSDWSFTVTRVLTDDNGSSAYEGELRPHHRVEVLRPSDLSSKRNLVSWSMKRGVSWLGSDTDAQALHSLLAHESIVSPTGRLTDVVGLHDGDYILPDLSIGQDRWVWMPRPGSLESLPDRFVLNPADPLATVDDLMDSASADVTHPLLAWFAAAPLRPLFTRFPTLSISGGSGSGKTTLTELFMHSFGGSDLTLNLTSTTPYAVTALMSSTNAVPVWFDEYRPGARHDAKLVLDQLIRDAYTGQRSARGQVKGNDLVLVETPTLVPLVVTGEDSFTETSHTDRMVSLRLSKATKGRLIPESYTSVMADYLGWLHRTGATTYVPFLTYRDDLAHLNDRQRENIAVLDYGWKLLGAYLQDIEPELSWPEPDFSMVTSQAQAAAEANPTLDAVTWALEAGIHNAVWERTSDEGHHQVLISPVELLREVHRAGVFTLPYSNAKGMVALLKEQHDAELARVWKVDEDGKRQVRVAILTKEEVYD